ncbi:hypothetical protein SipoB123_21510 [Streptomyces ipomoeae]|nr:hypothetical protein SipoB123_21510 [Streptomyces ipomoeae]
MVEMIHDLAACNAVVAVVTTDSLRCPAVAPKPAATTPPGMRLTRTRSTGSVSRPGSCTGQPALSHNV